jgi:hypothetical protein
LLTSTNATFAIGYPIWWPGRVAAAVILMLLVRRPWARGLAAAIAIPALYSYSIVLVYPVVVALVAQRRERAASR